MDSRQLRYFIAVYEQRNLSRAADQANVAQSALSHHIANLEAEFATPLFERKPRGMEPTAAGERLYEHARIILRAMAAAEREIREGGSEIAGVALPYLSSSVSRTSIRTAWPACTLAAASLAVIGLLAFADPVTAPKKPMLKSAVVQVLRAIGVSLSLGVH